MKMKFTAAVLIIIMLLSFAAYAEDDSYRMKYLQYEVNEEWASPNDYIVMRYKDTKEIIPMSLYSRGNVFALVDNDRELEVFQSEGIQFTDLYEGSYGFAKNYLSARGIVHGKGDGSFGSGENISRAEAVAMIVRALDLDSKTNSTFKDVPDDSWFAGSVAAALDFGIISEYEYFEPFNEVSRQELQTILKKAFEKMGLLSFLNDGGLEQLLSKYCDADEIADYALEAYTVLGMDNGIILSDYEYPDEYGIDDELPLYLYPDRPASRDETAGLIWECMNRLPIFPSQEAIELGFDIAIPVIDGSTSTYPFTTAVFSKMFMNYSKHPNFPKSHSKSHASYQRLINGEVDMIFASVSPASDILEMAAEKGVEFELIPIAYDAQVFFTNAENPIEGLTIEQISDIYVNNTYTNWSELGGTDAGFIPICRNNDSGSQSQMERYFLNGNAIHEDIQIENTSYTMSSVFNDVRKAAEENPGSYALTYSIYYYYHSYLPMFDDEDSFKLLAIDRVYPTDDTIADGSYPLSDNTYIVLRKDAPKNSPARTMAEYMLTESGQECVKSAGFGRLY